MHASPELTALCCLTKDNSQELDLIDLFLLCRDFIPSPDKNIIDSLINNSLISAMISSDTMPISTLHMWDTLYTDGTYNFIECNDIKFKNIIYKRHSGHYLLYSVRKHQGTYIPAPRCPHSCSKQTINYYC